jgi:uncharacterized protein with PIN domain/sulfur carrier protein ThiS
MSTHARSHTARLRFYAELNDFLPEARRQRAFDHPFDGRPGVKDVIESLGVPHTEVDVVLVNGVSVGFDHRVEDGDRVSVYPVFEAIDVSPLAHLRAAPLRETRFVLDGHLGKLARALRLLGFDAEYRRDFRDEELIARSLSGCRIILTRDRELLKVGAVTHGYWVRGTDPRQQIVEVLDRFDLRGDARPFTRCTVCNGELVPVPAAEAADEAPPRVRERCTEYQRCASCGKLYWKGTHVGRLAAFVRWAMGSSGAGAS